MFGFGVGELRFVYEIGFGLRFGLRLSLSLGSGLGWIGVWKFGFMVGIEVEVLGLDFLD